MPTKEYLKTHIQIVIPRECHEWIVRRGGEIERETGRRVSLGDVLVDVIAALESYEANDHEKSPRR